MILKYVEPLSFDWIIIDKVEKIRFGKIEAGFSCKDLKDYLNQKYEFLSNYNEDLIEEIDLVVGVVNWGMKKDGMRYSITEFDRNNKTYFIFHETGRGLGYLCNDDGKTIDKIN